LEGSIGRSPNCEIEIRHANKRIGEAVTDGDFCIPGLFHKTKISSE